MVPRAHIRQAIPFRTPIAARDRLRDVGGGGRDHDDGLDEVRASPLLRCELGREHGRIAWAGEGGLEVAADRSPRTPAAAARDGERHCVARGPAAAVPRRHGSMIT